MLQYLLKNIIYGLRELSKNIVKTLVSSFGIFFLIAFMVVYFSFRTSVKNYIDKQFMSKIDVNEIVIRPYEHPGKSGDRGELKIARWKINKIRRMKEFDRIYSVIRMDYFTNIEMSMLGQKRAPGIPIYGVERGFFKGEVKNWWRFVYKKGKPVPAVAPKSVHTLVNDWLSGVGFPTLSEKKLLGFKVRIYVRRQYVNKNIKKYPAELFAFSKKMQLIGAYVPKAFILSYVRAHSRELGRPVAGYFYTKVYAHVKDIRNLPAVTKKLKRLGLAIESRDDVSSSLMKGVYVVDAAMLLIGLVVLILTVLSIFNSYLVVVYNRSYSFSLKRVIGVSKMRIVLNFVIEAAIIGAIFGAIGYCAGYYLTDYLSNNLAQLLPKLKGLKIIRPDATVLFIAMGASMAISSLSALIPAIFASHKNLFNTVGR